MNFATKSRGITALRACLICLGVYGGYAVSARLENLALDRELMLGAARKARALAFPTPAAGEPRAPAALEDFRAGYYSLGSALNDKAMASPVNRAVLKAAAHEYYKALPLAEEFYLDPAGKARSAAQKVLKERVARIAAACLAAADRTSDERDLLLEKTALLAFVYLLLMAGLEAAAHCFIGAPFFERLETLRRRVRHCAWAPTGTAAFNSELDEIRACTEALERGLQESMLDRLRLAKESAGRRARMKTQTKALEITRKKVVELVEDLDAARTQLLREKKVLKETGEKLARSNKELEQFAYVASHDLKEPLRVVSSFSGLLSRRYTGRLDKEADDFIRYIEEGSNRGQELVNALFNYSKVSHSGQKFAQTDCALVLKKALFNLKITIEEKKAKVTWDEMPTLPGDEFQLLQMFQNLLSNALKFNCAPAPEVKITCAGTRNEWLLGFSDNGIGIPEAQYERIFLIFQRLHAVDKYPGAGIGLALCKKIAENHGGSIRVESVAGKGTTFWVSLPKAAPKTGSAGLTEDLGLLKGTDHE